MAGFKVVHFRLNLMSQTQPGWAGQVGVETVLQPLTWSSLPKGAVSYLLSLQKNGGDCRWDEERDHCLQLDLVHSILLSLYMPLRNFVVHLSLSGYP